MLASLWLCTIYTLHDSKLGDRGRGTLCHINMGLIIFHANSKFLAHISFHFNCMPVSRTDKQGLQIIFPYFSIKTYVVGTH